MVKYGTIRSKRRSRTNPSLKQAAVAAVAAEVGDVTADAEAEADAVAAVAVQLAELKL